MTDPRPEPLTPTEVEALLRPDPRTRAADLLVLRDALQRMADALERLSSAVQELGADVAAPHGAPLHADRVVERPRHPGLADAPASRPASCRPPAAPDEPRPGER